MRFLRDFSFSHSPASVVEACGRVCMYVCVSLVCVCCVFELGFFPLFIVSLLHRRYHVMKRLRVISPRNRANLGPLQALTHAVAHTYEAHGRLHTRTRTERVHFYFWLAVTAPVCCLCFFFPGRALLSFFLFFFITTSPPSCVAASGRACQFRSR